MSLAEDIWIDESLSRAKALAADLQPWPDYFEFKAEELKTILSFCEFSHARSILEIGCGNGFTSYLLSRRAGHVEAFDLPGRDLKSHSVGICMAEELASRMGAVNMSMRGGSVTDMPYGDGSFDVVFSQYMLQYVKDKKSALRQMRRVLSDNGMMVTIVPNFTERLLVPFIKCEYVIGALIRRIGKRNLQQVYNTPRLVTAEYRKACHSDELTCSAGSLRRLLNDYVSLRPDGAYGCYMEEMLSHRPMAWRRLLEESGFRVQGIFTTQALPVGLFVFLGRSGIKLLSRNIHRLTRCIGALPLLRGMGYSLGIIAVKG